MSEKTIKLYDENAYETNFEGIVKSCEPSGEDGKAFCVVLDRTLFFPEEGGQTPDRGCLWEKADDAGLKESEIPDNARKVLDVQIKDDVIYHYLDGPLKEGQTVTGAIDFEHRFSNMQQHTGEHIFSGIVHAKYGYENVSFHLSDSVVTMDYSGQLSEDELSEIERMVNRAIYENVPVIAKYPSGDELENMNYRSKKALTGDIRIVTVTGYDVCACCAPHVRNTGEIGILKVIQAQNYKGGTRVSILCGQRALFYLADEHKMISTLANDLSTSADNIPAQFRKLQQDISELKRRLSDTGEKLLDAELMKVPSELKSVCLFADGGMDSNVIRRFVNKMTAKREGFCGIFYGGDAEGYRFVIGCSSGRNCNELLGELRKAFNVRGGGAPAMVQGSITGAKRNDIKEIFGRYNDNE